MPESALKGLDIAGKTGTAQVAEVGKDSGKKRTMRGSSAIAPAYKPEISVHSPDRELRFRCGECGSGGKSHL